MFKKIRNRNFGRQYACEIKFKSVKSIFCTNSILKTIDIIEKIPIHIKCQKLNVQLDCYIIIIKIKLKNKFFKD